MDTSLIAHILAQATAAGGIATGVTQFFKTLERLPPVLQKIPYVGSSLSWIVDTITPEDPTAIRVFNFAVTHALTLGMVYAQTGQAEINLATTLVALAGFLESQGMYTLLFKNKKLSIGGEPISQ